MSKNDSWEKIFKDKKILDHNFSNSPFKITAQDIKESVQDFKKTAEKEVRILCKMDTRESLPKIMRDNGLFLLPTKNGEYVIIRGEGYLDIEVDAGYEGKDDIVLVEAKNSKTKNTIIRQLYYPYRQWSKNTNKKVRLLFFEKRGKQYMFWEYKFKDIDDYNSITLVKSKKYIMSKKA